MECHSLLAVGDALHGVGLHQHVALYIIREEKEEGYYCQKQSSQNVVNIFGFDHRLGLIHRDIDLSVHALLQRDERFRLRNAGDVLDLVVEQLH